MKKTNQRKRTNKVKKNVKEFYHVKEDPYHQQRPARVEIFLQAENLVPVGTPRTHIK